jgi:hypothetical protein
MSEQTAQQFRPYVHKHFMSLRKDEVAAFVQAEIGAIRLLGRPFDIEHPLLSFSGNFGDDTEIEHALQRTATRLRGKLIALPTTVTTVEGPVRLLSWTILRDVPGSSFCKVRLYLNERRTCLTAAAMEPYGMDSDALSVFPSALPPSFTNLWNRAADASEAAVPSPLARQRSLVSLANYLGAMGLLRKLKDILDEELNKRSFERTWIGPTIADLQLLVGPTLAVEASSILSASLTNDDTLALDEARRTLAARAMTPGTFRERISNPDRRAIYEEKRQELLCRARNVEDALRAIFYAQHLGLDLPTRAPDANPDGARLDFGLPFSELRKLVGSVVPGVSDIAIHTGLDRLIDEGSVVPRYMNIGSESNPYWKRVFRVGEGPLEKVAHTIRLLFELLRDSLQERAVAKWRQDRVSNPTLVQPAIDKVPATLFEKFCVLAWSVSEATDIIDLRQLPVVKEFGLYGARPAYRHDDGTSEMLVKWARDRGFLVRDRETESYFVPDLDVLLPRDESPWSAEVRDALEDHADFATFATSAAFSSNKPIVTITSVATEREYLRAIEAELYLWLYDAQASVYHALRQLGELATATSNGASPHHSLLQRINELLGRTSNYSTQVETKTDYAKSRAETFDRLTTVTETSKLERRVWRSLRSTLESRASSESVVPGKQEILSALRVVHLTNRVMREILSLAGPKDPRSKGLPAALDSLKLLLFDDASENSRPARALFGPLQGHRSISTLLADIRVEQLRDVASAFEVVRPIVLEVAARCDLILRSFGTSETHEEPEKLDPPKYIMMWDVRGSTNSSNRTKIEENILRLNTQLSAMRGASYDFHASMDDGNGVICDSFQQVLATFDAINNIFQDMPFRAGCEINFQAELLYYRKRKLLGGRAFEYAARTSAFFKEIKADPSLWNGAAMPTEPDTSYLVVGEFARRTAEHNREWNLSGFTDQDLGGGAYTARIKLSLPAKVSVLVPVTK